MTEHKLCPKCGQSVTVTGWYHENAYLDDADDEYTVVCSCGYRKEMPTKGIEQTWALWDALPTT
jgi:C4-type Zn-finger protein